MKETVQWELWRESSPESGEKLRVITPSGDERTLAFQNGMWWLPDMSMYVYFTPVFWRRATEGETL